MQVILAKTAGFCYGVERAVHMAEVAAREGGCVMLGSIIHNDRVITALEALGARQADSPQQVRPGETVIIRAHGETREALRVLEERGAQIMDATCPHVLRIHRLVEQAARAGRTPIIIGEAHHPEVMAAASRCERSVVLENTAELADWVAADPARKDMDLLYRYLRCHKGLCAELQPSAEPGAEKPRHRRYGGVPLLDKDGVL